MGFVAVLPIFRTSIYQSCVFCASLRQFDVFAPHASAVPLSDGYFYTAGKIKPRY
jgi:hypothetical protein